MVRLIRSAVFALLFAAPLIAEEAPHFLVERIDVRNLRHASPEIVIAESRIRSGQSYSEQELRVARDRIVRLPFVLMADFALEKGSVRDAYVLVINVTEAKPFFYLADFVPVISHSPPSDDVGGRGAVGLRFFAGRRGMFHIGISGENDKRPYTDDYDAYEAGYTHYDILGSRAFATINLRQPITGTRDNARILPQVVVGIPISPNQTVTALYSALDVGSQEERRSRVAERIATLRLTYNTTNHPFFPTRGILVTVAPVAVWTDRKGLQFLPPSFDVQPFVVHSRSLALEGTASRYWELSERYSLSTTLDGGSVRFSARGTTDRYSSNRFGSVDFGVSRRLTDLAVPLTEGESRVEFHLHTATRQEIYARVFRAATSQASLAWVKRNAWGNLRLGLGYGW